MPSWPAVTTTSFARCAVRTRSRVSSKISDEDFDATWSRGLLLSLDEVIDEAAMIVDEVDSPGAAGPEGGAGRSG